MTLQNILPILAHVVPLTHVSCRAFPSCMQVLRGLLRDGLLGRAARGNQEEIAKLGVQFKSCDSRLLNDLLPERAQEKFQGLMIMPKGAATHDFIFDTLLNTAHNLTGAIRDMQV